jgi:hypothetical protein
MTGWRRELRFDFHDNNFLNIGKVCMGSLLAVDLAIRTGLALHGREGRLLWYRSQYDGSTERLRRAVAGVLGETPDVEELIIEGGGTLEVPWEREAERRGILVLKFSAEEWRSRGIQWSGSPAPTSLRHDAAEAILAGLCVAGGG